MATRKKKPARKTPAPRKSARKKPTRKKPVKKKSAAPKKASRGKAKLAAKKGPAPRLDDAPPLFDLAKTQAVPVPEVVGEIEEKMALGRLTES